MFGLENNYGWHINFLSQVISKAMAILILHILQFGGLKILTSDHFMLRISNITYSKQKIGCLIHISIFTITFPRAYFPIYMYRVCWRSNGV